MCVNTTIIQFNDDYQKTNGDHFLAVFYFLVLAVILVYDGYG